MSSAHDPIDWREVLADLRALVAEAPPRQMLSVRAEVLERMLWELPPTQPAAVGYRSWWI